ncbi:MAG: TPM domain-containing protein [Bacteroidia bacterium]|nr:TPM domain-containing protein [Bacteroidia bacterium]NNL33527.1 TPM domain-containing protein [Flavobacteriaceae bacterium]RZW42943.1 MAG: TPM domain-containing protein [Flavobacteriaceae bacterium]
MRSITLAIITVFICMGLTTPVFSQFKIPEKPQTAIAVYDDIKLLSAIQKQELSEKLIRYADTTSTQIVVAIISSTNDDDITLVGAQWGHEWGIGQADEDNGILILLAKDDREIDINTGYGMEYRLTDILAERIINRIMIPEFKNGNFYEGLDKGTDAIFQVLNGEFQADPQTGVGPTDFPVGLIIFLIVMFVIFLIAISSNRRGKGGGGNRNHRNLDSRDILEAIIFSNMGRGSFGRSSGGFGGSSGGSFGGGGFSGGFGGGGFGGGGASGSW